MIPMESIDPISICSCYSRIQWYIDRAGTVRLLCSAVARVPTLLFRVGTVQKNSSDFRPRYKEGPGRRLACYPHTPGIMMRAIHISPIDCLPKSLLCYPLPFCSVRRAFSARLMAFYLLVRVRAPPCKVVE